MAKPIYKTEAELCTAYIEWIGDNYPDWTAYPETADFDIVLVHSSGYQIGLEAKQRLNAKVIEQAIEGRRLDCGPDFRGVLVGAGGSSELRAIARALGVQVVQCNGRREPGRTHVRKLNRNGDSWSWVSEFSSGPPNLEGRGPVAYGDNWPEWIHHRRLELPDYVPDVPAGVAGPVKLTSWKIKAIKIQIILEELGTVTTAQFKALGLSPQIWVGNDWLERVARGVMIGGPFLPDLREAHPRNFEEIRADFPKWSKGLPDLEISGGGSDSDGEA
jgi:hypothetical protein